MGRGLPDTRWRRGALLALALAACRGSPEPENPLELTLVNRTGGAVTGAVLRFEEPVARVDRISGGGFPDIRLRVAPANTLRLEGGVLEVGHAATYEIVGVDGPPRLLEARWVVDGVLGPALRDPEIVAR